MRRHEHTTSPLPLFLDIFFFAQEIATYNTIILNVQSMDFARLIEGFNIQNSAFCLQYIYVFLMIPTINSDCNISQHSTICVSNASMLYSL